MPGHSDGRLVSPTFLLNSEPVCAALVARLASTTGHALEIGSGTGQHVQAFSRALPHLNWHPSDPDSIHRTSIDAWSRAESSALPAARNIDASKNFSTGLADIAPLRLMFSMNVIHIAPWSVTKSIIATAGQCLTPGGWLGFYGPFKEGGQHTGEGNANFDACLRADNPAWGVRNIDDLATLAQAAGLSRPDVDPMPANNRIVWFCRNTGL